MLLSLVIVLLSYADCIPKIETLAYNYLEPTWEKPRWNTRVEEALSVEEYLIKNTNSTRYRDNIRLVRYAAEHLDWMPKNPSFSSRSLFQMIASLEFGNYGLSCSAENLVTTAEVKDVVEHSLKGRDSRLSRVIRDYSAAETKPSRCVQKLVNQWTANDYAIDESFNKEYGQNLAYINRMNLLSGPQKYKQHKDALNKLEGALELNIQSRSSDDNELVVRARQVVASIHLRANSSIPLRVSLFKGTWEPDAKRPSITEMIHFLDRYILVPCRSLLKRKESETILQSIIALGMQNKLNIFEDLLGPLGKFVDNLLNWTARYETCKWFTRQNKTQLAKNIVEYD